MSRFNLFRWFRNVSISKKLYFTVGIMALLIGIELFTLFFSLHTLSSVRAYVGGEGLWSKAQKDATYHLYKYGVERKEEDYRLFYEFMKVPLGDSKTRKELMKANPDLDSARQGFREGRIHEDDIDGMIKLFRRFSNISYISRAIKAWNEAEALATQLPPIADSMHAEINSPNPSNEKINAFLARLSPLNDQLTRKEDEFSFTLGEGSRWLEGLVMKLLFIIALTVEITGLLLAISVSRSIQKGLAEIISASKEFAHGNLSRRAKVFSTDEIGEVAQSFNQMSGELKQGIEELDSAQQKFRSLLESAPDAMVIVNAQGKIQLVNSQTEKLFGYNRSELLGHRIDVLVPAQHHKEHPRHMQEFFSAPVARSMGAGLNLTAVKKDGSEFPVEISLSPLETKEGTLVSAAIRDISERKHIIELENKNRELEQFAYIASHDLQEPLNTITSFIMLLEDEFKGNMSGEATQYVSYIRESSDRLRMLITGLLEYSRIGKKSQLGQVDCNEVAADVVSDMSSAISESGASVIVDMLPTITAYPVEIRLLFQNLISNAIKYRRKDVAPIVRVSAETDPRNWHFIVEDNGIGIEKKYTDRLFVIFQRLHSSNEYQGTGIGLAHCKKIAEIHNGKIWVESEPGVGSKFHFTIPKNL